MCSESHKLLQKDSVGDLCHSSHSAMGLSCCLSRPHVSKPQHLAVLFLASILDLMGSKSRAGSCSPSASCPLPLAADVAVVAKLLWLLLQGSKVTSVPITGAVAEVLALGAKQKLLGC